MCILVLVYKKNQDTLKEFISNTLNNISKKMKFPELQLF